MEKKDKTKLIQQRMAVDRTVLANERTFLSYTRTALSLLVVGLSFLHFADSIHLTIIAIAFIPAALLIFGFAIYRFRKLQQRIREERKCIIEADQIIHCS